KQKQIINAAINEFAQRGFDRASTNEIIKNANISKGSLFNYFNRKKDLYIYLIDHSIKVIEEMYEQIDTNEMDLFKRIEKIGIQKLHIQHRFPHVFDYLATAFQEESNDAKSIIEEKVTPLYDQGLKKIYEGIDYSMFHEDIDIEKAIDILNWTML